MANEILLGSIKDLGNEFIIQVSGRVLGLRIVGSFTGTIAFQSRNGAAEWASQSLKALDGTEESASSTTAGGDWRGLVPRTEFRCVSSAWTGGIAYINAVVEEPMVTNDPPRPLLVTLADTITGAHVSDPFHLDYLCDTHACVVNLEDVIEGAGDGENWKQIVIVDISGSPLVDGLDAQVFKSGYLPPAVGWVRLNVTTLNAAEGEATPHLTFKYCGMASP